MGLACTASPVDTVTLARVAECTVTLAAPRLTAEEPRKSPMGKQAVLGWVGGWVRVRVKKGLY